MSLYSRLSQTREGGRALAVARLKYEVLRLIHMALTQAGITQVELAKRLRVRKSAVNQVLRGDGNVRISTLAEYLYAIGAEVELRLVPAGKPREEAARDMRQSWASSTAVEARLLPGAGRSVWPAILVGADVETAVDRTHSPLLLQSSAYAGSTIEVVKR